MNELIGGFIDVGKEFNQSTYVTPKKRKRDGDKGAGARKVPSTIKILFENSFTTQVPKASSHVRAPSPTTWTQVKRNRLGEGAFCVVDSVQGRGGEGNQYLTCANRIFKFPSLENLEEDFNKFQDELSEVMQYAEEDGLTVDKKIEMLQEAFSGLTLEDCQAVVNDVYTLEHFKKKKINEMISFKSFLYRELVLCSKVGGNSHVINYDLTEENGFVRGWDEDFQLFVEQVLPFIEKNGIYTKDLMKGDLKSSLAQLDRLPEEGKISIYQDIARGVKALHDKNIIHNDLKPDNVLVGEIKAKGSSSVKVTDLGLASTVPSRFVQIKYHGGLLRGNAFYQDPGMTSSEGIVASFRKVLNNNLERFLVNVKAEESPELKRNVQFLVNQFLGKKLVEDITSSNPSLQQKAAEVMELSIKDLHTGSDLYALGLIFLRCELGDASDTEFTIFAGKIRGAKSVDEIDFGSRSKKMLPLIHSLLSGIENRPAIDRVILELYNMQCVSDLGEMKV